MVANARMPPGGEKKMKILMVAREVVEASQLQ
jgi:hypothetical protein